MLVRYGCVLELFAISIGNDRVYWLRYCAKVQTFPSGRRRGTF